MNRDRIEGNGEQFKGQKNQDESQLKTLPVTAIAAAIALCASACRVVDRRIGQPALAPSPSERRGQSAIVIT